MITVSNITILPAKGCRRSRRIIEHLEKRSIPFTWIALESPEGQALVRQHDLRASPGILAGGVSVNPFDLLRPGCRVDEERVARLLLEK